MPDASSWNQALVGRSGGAATPFRGEMPFRLLCWARILLILSHMLYIQPMPFLVVVFAAAAANWAAAWAEAHGAPDISLLSDPWAVVW